jgi:hypothetical protein
MINRANEQNYYLRTTAAGGAVIYGGLGFITAPPANIVQHFPGGDTSQPADYITYDETINGATYTWRLDFTWAANGYDLTAVYQTLKQGATVLYTDVPTQGV